MVGLAGRSFSAFERPNVHTYVHTPPALLGCTICRTCREAMPDSAGVEQRENGIEQRE